MLVAACGMACEVCRLLKDDACEMCGCVPGTDERVQEKQMRMKAEVGTICTILECASKKKIDFCFKCPEFPCEAYYAHEMPDQYASSGMKYKPFPYSREFLDRFKSEKEAPC